MPIRTPKARHPVFLERDAVSGDLPTAAEQARNSDFTVVDGGYDAPALETISLEFNASHERYVGKHSAQRLHSIGELHVIRGPLTHSGDGSLQRALAQHAEISQFHGGAAINSDDGDNEQRELPRHPRHAGPLVRVARDCQPASDAIQ